MDAYEIQSDLLKALSHSTRLAILDILRDGEQCVCHMEAALNLRQAYISQQLMISETGGAVGIPARWIEPVLPRHQAGDIRCSGFTRFRHGRHCEAAQTQTFERKLSLPEMQCCQDHSA